MCKFEIDSHPSYHIFAKLEQKIYQIAHIFDNDDGGHRRPYDSRMILYKVYWSKMRTLRSNWTFTFQKNGTSQISHLSKSLHAGATVRFDLISQQISCPVSSAEKSRRESIANDKLVSFELCPLKTFCLCFIRQSSIVLIIARIYFSS